jgi:hypothetical protein
MEPETLSQRLTCRALKPTEKDIALLSQLRCTIVSPLTQAPDALRKWTAPHTQLKPEPLSYSQIRAKTAKDLSPAGPQEAGISSSDVLGFWAEDRLAVAVCRGLYPDGTLHLGFELPNNTNRFLDRRSQTIADVLGDSNEVFAILRRSMQSPAFNKARSAMALVTTGTDSDKLVGPLAREFWFVRTSDLSRESVTGLVELQRENVSFASV